MTPELLIALWRRALQAEIGIEVPIPDKDVARFKNMLYNARKEAKDPELAGLSICSVVGGKAIFIIKKTVELTE